MAPVAELSGQVAKFTQLALREAYQSQEQKRLGAVVARRGKILGVGSNTRKTHPLSRATYQTTHAEVAAIASAKDSLQGATLYVVRILRDGSVAMSKPCPGCQALAESVGIKTIIYTTDCGMLEYMDYD